MTDEPGGLTEVAFAVQSYETPFREPEGLHQSILEIVGNDDPEQVVWDSPPFVCLHYDNGDTVLGFMISEEIPEPKIWAGEAARQLKEAYIGDGVRIVSVTLYVEGWVNSDEDGSPQDEGKLVSTAGENGYDKQSIYLRLKREWVETTREDLGIPDLPVVREIYKEVSA